MQINHLPGSLLDVGPMAYKMILLGPAAAKAWGMSSKNDGNWHFYAPNELAMKAAGEMIFPHFSIKSGTKYWSIKKGREVTRPDKVSVDTVHLTPKAGPSKAENPHLWWDGVVDRDGFYIFKEDRAHNRQCSAEEYRTNKKFLEDFLNKIRAACKAEKLRLAKPERTEPVEIDKSAWD